MKKSVIFLLFVILLFACSACGKQEKAAKEEQIPAVMIKDVLFYRMNIGMLGIDEEWTADGTITSEVSSDQIPSENDQSNFGTGYEYQLADGLYGVFIKSGEKIELFQMKDQGEFVYEDQVFEKAVLSDEEFEWLSRYSLADEDDRKDMTMPEELLEKGIPVEEYRQ